MKRAEVLSGLLVAALLPAAGAAWSADPAANYPRRPIRLIVPNAPGSSVDTLSRIMGNKLPSMTQNAKVVAAVGLRGTQQ